MMPDIYEIVNDRILAAMDRGVVPWVKPWTGSMPANLKTGREYSGANVISLWASEMCQEFKSSYWATFNQIRDLGGHVLKGSKSTPIVFYEPRGKEVQKEDGSTELIVTSSVLRYYNAFNLDQTEGIEAPALNAPKDPNVLNACNGLLASMPTPPGYQESGSIAAYSPRSDKVLMPAIERFKSTEGYVAAKFHEYAHSTGHEKRLNREGIQDSHFGDDKYSFEELVAELASAFLCAHVGCDSGKQIENSAAYIQNWSAKFKEDRRMLMKAAAQARKAADFVRGI
jgi:antirestriction protein ArdC